MDNFGGDGETAQAPEVDLTILVPVLNEAENMRPLIEKLARDLKPLGKSYEILVIDDGSTDGTFDQVRSARPFDPRAPRRPLPAEFRKIGRPLAGISRGARRVVVTMDGDLQDDSAGSRGSSRRSTRGSTWSPGGSRTGRIRSARRSRPSSSTR